MRSDACTRRFALNGDFAAIPQIMCLAAVHFHRGVILVALLAVAFTAGCSSRDRALRRAGSPRYDERDVEVRLPAGGCVTGGCHVEMGKIGRTHSPVRERRCDACHVERSPGHRGSPGPEFGPGTDRHDAPCLSCHGSLAGEIRSATALHAPVAQGRCGACHETHGGRQPALMRKSVPFGTGGWKLPVRFTPTSNGGSCVVGCHRLREYDRGFPGRRNP